jgi:SUMO ligase MMS21 Smc5/6 complex component
MQTDTRDLYTRIGALYVSLTRSEESVGKMVEDLADAQDRNNKMAAKLGNALAHLEVHDKETYDKIMAGETVPVLGDG